MTRREYSAALYPFRASSNSAVTYLKSFSESNKTGFDTKELDKALDNAEKAKDLKSETQFIKQAEKAVISTYSVFPVIAETSYYASAKGVKGIQFHAGTGRVSFINATRKE